MAQERVQAKKVQQWHLGELLGSGLPREGLIHASVRSMFRYLITSEATNFENIQMILQLSMFDSLVQFVVTGCLLCLYRMMTVCGIFNFYGNSTVMLISLLPWIWSYNNLIVQFLCAL